MDDILASIRRILNDDDKTAKEGADGVLVLEPSMMMPDETDQPAGHPAPEHAGPAAAPAQPQVADALLLATADEPVHSDLVIDQPAPPASAIPTHDAIAPMASSLVAPAAAAAAANSVSTLMRTLAAERTAALGRGGVTIEDLVREEMRPVLKAWLDTHLPPLVERLVQVEIERVVGRIAG